jgi:hypothetical protein
VSLQSHLDETLLLVTQIQSLDRPRDSDLRKFHDLLDELVKDAEIQDTFLTGPERKAWENPYDLVSINSIPSRDLIEKAICKLIDKVSTPGKS